MINLTKEILEYEYKRLGSMQKVANELKVSIDSIYKYMKLYGIEYFSHYRGKYKCEKDIFKEKNETSLYLAGFIAADGCLIKNKYSKTLKIALGKKDMDHLDNIRNLLGSDHKIGEYEGKYPWVELRITNEEIFDDLGKFNIIPNKTKIYHMPEWLKEDKLVHHFLRGYFDGDGCIGGGKQKSFGILGTEKMMEEYREVLMGNGLNKVKILKYNNVYRLNYCGNGNIKKIYNYLYNGAEIYLDRKKRKFEEI